MPHKLVLDTNTIVSAFFWDGNEAELLRKVEQEKALLFISLARIPHQLAVGEELPFSPPRVL